MQLQRYMMIRHLDGWGVKFVVISTWSYENRVSKHFVIVLNSPCLIACLLCFLLMSYFLGLSWQHYYLSHPRRFLFSPTHNFVVLTGMWSRGWTVVSPKYSVPAIKIVSSVLSLADCTLEKQLSTEENWI